MVKRIHVLYLMLASLVGGCILGWAYAQLPDAKLVASLVECEPCDETPHYQVGSYTGIQFNCGPGKTINSSDMTGTVEITTSEHGLRLEADLIFGGPYNVGDWSSPGPYLLTFKDGLLHTWDGIRNEWPKTVDELVESLHHAREAEPVETLTVNQWTAFLYDGSYHAEPPAED